MGGECVTWKVHAHQDGQPSSSPPSGYCLVIHTFWVFLRLTERNLTFYERSLQFGGKKKKKEKEGGGGKSWEVGKKGREGETMQDTHPASCLHACGHLLTGSLFLPLTHTHPCSRDSFSLWATCNFIFRGF